MLHHQAWQHDGANRSTASQNLVFFNTLSNVTLPRKLEIGRETEHEEGQQQQQQAREPQNTMVRLRELVGDPHKKDNNNKKNKTHSSRRQLQLPSSQLPSRQLPSRRVQINEKKNQTHLINNREAETSSRQRQEREERLKARQEKQQMNSLKNLLSRKKPPPGGRSESVSEKDDSIIDNVEADSLVARGRPVDRYKYIPSAFDDKTMIYSVVNANDEPVSFKVWVSDSIVSDRSRRFFISMLSDSSFDSFFFECEGVTIENWDKQQFRFALVDAPELDERATSLLPDTASYEAYFKIAKDQGNDFTSFFNGDRDCILVCPLPSTRKMNMCTTDLGRFLRHAPIENTSSFICNTLKVFRDTLMESSFRDAFDGSPVHLSTHGMGVNWLHMRIEPKMKHYVSTCFGKNSDAPSPKTKTGADVLLSLASVSAKTNPASSNLGSFFLKFRLVTYLVLTYVSFS